MEFRRLLCYIFVNCVLIQYLNAKTVSLNELIAAEQREKKTELEDNSLPSKSTDRITKPISTKEFTTTETQPRRGLIKLPTSKLTELLKRLPILKRLASNTKIKRLREDRASLTRTLFGDSKVSPLRYRKEFLIKSPLKPKKLKVAPNSRYKRRNQSKKREISGNDHLRQKYIPLLKSLSMLFDNLIEPDASNTNEIKTENHKKYRFSSGDIQDSSRKSNSRIDIPRSQKKTIIPSPPVPSETSSNTENFTSSEDNDYSINRPNTSIPILLSRNTFGSRRNNNGSSTRSRPAYNRNIERNITRDHRTHEHNTRFGKSKPYAESNENHTYSNTRNDTSSFRYTRTGRDRYNSQNSTNRKAVEFNTSKNESTTDLYRKDKFETGGIETESESFVRKPVRRIRGRIPKIENSHDERFTTEPIQYEKIHEEGVLSTSNNSASHKRIPNKSSTITNEDEKICSGNETVICIGNDYPHTENYTNVMEEGEKRPFVLIFDGYSVTRDKNGKNKVSGKAIQIHS